MLAAHGQSLTRGSPVDDDRALFPMTPLAEQIPSRHPSAVVERVGGRTMVATDDDVLHVFVNEQEEPSEVAERIFELSDGTRTVRQISEVICNEFEVDFETALDDAGQFIARLVEQKVLVLGNPTAARPTGH